MNATAATQLSSVVRAHQHLHAELCPTCEQEIPNEKAAEIRARAEARSRELTDSITAKVTEQFTAEKAQIEQDAVARIKKAETDKADALTQLRGEMERQVATAREQSEKAAEEKANARINDLVATNQTALAELEQKLAQAEQGKSESLDQLNAVKEQHKAELDRQIRETQEAADKKYQGQLAEQTQASANRIGHLEESLDAAIRAKDETAGQIESLKTLHQDELSRQGEALKQEAEQALTKRLAEKEEEATQKLTALEQHLEASESQKREAVAQVESLKASREEEIVARVNETRTALEDAKTQAVNELNAKHASDTQQLTNKLEDMKRQLEKHTAAELGEGAEIKLFEALKGAYEDDRFRPVRKGEAGADLIQEVMHNGRHCGTIIYDSKNRMNWRDDYVTKLREDQLNANADFAILASRKLPKQKSQICVEDEVIVANAARVVAIVEVLRRMIIQTHGLRATNAERAQKSAAVFDLIRSEKFRQLFDRFDKHAASLLKLQEKEKRAHDAHWRKEGTLYRKIQKAHGDLTVEIDTALGITAETEEGL